MIDLSSIQKDSIYKKKEEEDIIIEEPPEEILKPVPDFERINEIVNPPLILDPKQRECEILTLKLILNRFRDTKLRQFRTLNIDLLSDDDLKITREKFLYILSTSSNVDFTIEIFKKLCEVFEYLGTNFTPLKLNGFSEVVTKDDEIIDDLYLVIIEYWGAYTTMKPSTRLMLNLTKTIMKVHEFNSTKSEIAMKQNEDIKKVNDKFNDL